jgi:hypothetical protein
MAPKVQWLPVLVSNFIAGLAPLTVILLRREKSSSALKMKAKGRLNIP